MRSSSEAGNRRESFCPGEGGKAFERLDLFAPIHLGALQGGMQDLDGSVVSISINRVGCAVFSAVGKGKAGWVASGALSTVDQLRYKRQGTQRLGADTPDPQKLFVAPWRGLIGLQQDFVEVLRVEIAQLEPMMHR